jgi:hypothetical protein
MNRLLPFLGVALLAAACASEPEPKPQPAPPPAPDPQAEVVVDEPLFFFSSNGQTAPYPFVKATIRDGNTHLLVDTSMGQHILTRRFADSVRAPIKSSRQVGSNDGSFTPIEGRIGVTIGNAKIDLDSVYAAEGQEFLERFELGGYLSATRVTPTGTVVLDFGNGRLKVLEGPPEKVAQWVDEKYPGLSEAATMTDAGPVVMASLGERKPVPVQIDTTGETAFEASYVNDDTPTGQALSDQAVAIGETSFDKVTVRITDDVPDTERVRLRGTIGPEALLPCVLVFNGPLKSFRFACQ